MNEQMNEYIGKKRKLFLTTGYQLINTEGNKELANDHSASIIVKLI